MSIPDHRSFPRSLHADGHFHVPLQLQYLVYCICSYESVLRCRYSVLSAANDWAAEDRFQAQDVCHGDFLAGCFVSQVQHPHANQESKTDCLNVAAALLPPFVSTSCTPRSTKSLRGTKRTQTPSVCPLSPLPTPHPLILPRKHDRNLHLGTRRAQHVDSRSLPSHIRNALPRRSFRTLDDPELKIRV